MSEGGVRCYCAAHGCGCTAKTNLQEMKIRRSDWQSLLIGKVASTHSPANLNQDGSSAIGTRWPESGKRIWLAASATPGAESERPLVRSTDRSQGFVSEILTPSGLAKSFGSKGISS